MTTEEDQKPLPSEIEEKTLLHALRFSQCATIYEERRVRLNQLLYVFGKCAQYRGRKTQASQWMWLNKIEYALQHAHCEREKTQLNAVKVACFTLQERKEADSIRALYRLGWFSCEAPSYAWHFEHKQRWRPMPHNLTDSAIPIYLGTEAKEDRVNREHRRTSEVDADDANDANEIEEREDINRNGGDEEISPGEADTSEDDEDEIEG